MSNEPTNAAPERVSQPGNALPPWAIPIVRACNAVYPYLLMLGAVLLLIILLALGLAGKKDLSWAYTVIGLMTFVLSVGLLAMLIAEYKSVLPGWVCLILGIALFYAPLLLALLAAQVGLPADHRLVAKLSGTCKSLGVFIVFIAILDLMAVYVRHFLVREAKRREMRFQYVDSAAVGKNIEKPGLLPKCWQMSRCRPSVRNTCPNYIDHVTCWKRRSGCFCDRELANFLIGSVGRGEAQEVMDVQRRAGVAQAVNAVRGRMTEKSKRPSWKQQKQRCHSCPLYIEHQEYKYRNYSWMSFFITIAVVVAAWPFFDLAYKKGVGYLDAFLSGRVNIPGITTDTSLATSPFEYVLYAVIFLLLWGYVIDLMDKYFLEWKL